MGVWLCLEEEPLLLQVFKDGLGRVVDVGAGEPSEAFYEDPELVKGGWGRESVLPAKLKVLLSSARSYVDQSGSLRLPHLPPHDDAVRLGDSEPSHCLQFVVGSVVGPALHLSPLKGLKHLVPPIGEDRRKRPLR